MMSHRASDTDQPKRVYRFSVHGKHAMSGHVSEVAL